MSTECYAQVRGSAIRVTGLDRCGDLPDEIQYAVSKSVVKVSIEEVADGGSDQMLRNDAGKRRLRLVRPEQTVKYVANIEFNRVDPGLLNLITGVPLVTADRVWGFGEMPFGVGPFGGSYAVGPGADGDVVGYDMKTRLVPRAFALEVWTRLQGRDCAGKWGYTVFPFLKGGRLSGFRYDRGGSVSFSVVDASTRMGNDWGDGPFLEDQDMALPVSGNTHWRNVVIGTPPPEQTDGVITFLDEIDGGSPSISTEDEIDGGTASMSTPDEIDGGAA